MKTPYRTPYDNPDMLPAPRMQMLPNQSAGLPPASMEPPSLRDIFDTLFRHKKKMAILMLIALATGLWMAQRTPRTFTSEAKILITRGRETLALQPTADTGKILPVYREWVNELNTEFEILQSKDLLAGVVAEVTPEVLLAHQLDAAAQRSPARRVSRLVRAGLRLIPFLGSHVAAAPRQPRSDPVQLERRALRHIQSHVDCERIRKSDVITIRYADTDRLLAQRVVETVVRHYRDKHIAVHRRPGVYDFFERQTLQLSSELAVTEEKLRDLKNRMGISSLGEQRNITLNHIKLLHQQKETLAADISSSAAKVRTLRSQLATRNGALARGVGAPRRKDIDEMTSQLLAEEITMASLKATVDTLAMQMNNTGSQRVSPNQLAELHRQRSEARSLYAASAAKVSALKLILNKSAPLTDGGKAPIDMANYNAIQSALWEEETEFASQVAQARTIESQLAQAGEKIHSLNNDETNIRRLERQQRDIEGKISKYTSNLEQVRINRELESSKISNLTVIQPATDPIWADGNARSIIMLLSLLIGTVGSVGLAFASEQFDHTVRRPEDIHRRLNLRLLTTIPKMSLNRPVSSHSRQRATQWWRRARRWGGWPVREEAQRHYALLRDRVMAAAQAHTARPVLLGLTSCHRGEGVSSIASDLAVTLARQGREFPVLLVDPCEYSPGKRGATQAVSRATQITTDENGHISMLERNLSVVDPDFDDSGQPCEEPRSTFRELIEFLRTHDASFVVFDLPPLKEGGHVLELAALLDNTIVVVESERTRWETVRWASDLLNEAGGNALGMVLNKRAYYIPSWLYRRI